MNSSFLNKNYVFSALLCLGLSACGKAADSSAPSASAGSAASSSPAVQQGRTGNNYVTGSDLPFQDAEGHGGVLPAGTGVTMLETRPGQGGASMVRLGVDSDDESLPSDVWVKMEELAGSSLTALEESDLVEEDFLESVFQEARRRGGRGRGRGGMTYCYRYVKQYLQKQGLVGGYLPGASAWMAASVLPRYGWHRISGGPESARVNDVCVYRGGRGGNGHAEVRVPGGWYYGYGVKPNPITRVNHPFLGCFRK